MESEDSGSPWWLNEVGPVLPSAHYVERILTSILPTSVLSRFSQPDQNPTSYLRFCTEISASSHKPSQVSLFHSASRESFLKQLGHQFLCSVVQLSPFCPVRKCTILVHPPLGRLCWYLPPTQSHIPATLDLPPFIRSTRRCHGSVLGGKEPEEKKQGELPEGKMAEGGTQQLMRAEQVKGRESS